MKNKLFDILSERYKDPNFNKNYIKILTAIDDSVEWSNLSKGKLEFTFSVINKSDLVQNKINIFPHFLH